MPTINKSAINYIDLFAGAGGLSEGFMRQGCQAIAHIEMNSAACDTLRTRAVYHYLRKHGNLSAYDDYLRGKIDRAHFWKCVPDSVVDSVINKEISEESIGELFKKIDLLKGDRKVDLIIGGPPCQAYSVAGRARDPLKMANDPRNYLFRFYLKYLERYQPSMFVFENVPGLLSAQNGNFYKMIKQGLKDCGYQVEDRIIIASNHGVLQNRRRVILIGWRANTSHHYPQIAEEVNKFQVLKDLFSDLPPRSPGEGVLHELVSYIRPATNYLRESCIRGDLPYTTQHIARPHNGRDLKIYEYAIKLWLYERKRLSYPDLPEEWRTHKNLHAFLNRYQVVNDEGSCHTVVAHIAKDGHYYIYPSLEQIRSITVREAARLQSFPDDYFFEGSRSDAFKQIGNAVPVLLGEKIAKGMLEQFKR